MGDRSERLGTLCGVVPSTIAVPAIALFWLCIGVWHICVIFWVIIDGATEELEEWGMEPSCQGSQCHKQMVRTWTSCHSLNPVTFQLRYLVVGSLAVIFGGLGFSGACNRNKVQSEALGIFVIFVAAFYMVVLCIDIAYCEVCQRLPLNMAKEVWMFMPAEERDLFEAQGITKIERLPLWRVNRYLGVNVPLYYATFIILASCFWSYAAYKIWEFAQVCAGGPLGLGPLYMISADPNRDLYEAADRMADMLDGEPVPPRYSAFPNLQDAQKYPYLTSNGGRAGNAITYGTIGAP